MYTYLLKLITIIVSDVYLKKFITFESCGIDEQYTIKFNKVSLNTSGTSGPIKNPYFEITDSNIDHVSIHTDLTMHIGNVKLFINPINTHTVPKTTSSTISPSVDSIFLEIKNIIHSLLNKFKLTIDNCSIIINKFNLILNIESISATYTQITCTKMSTQYLNININLHKLLTTWSTKQLLIDELIIKHNDKLITIKCLLLNLTKWQITFDSFLANYFGNSTGTNGIITITHTEDKGVSGGGGGDGGSLFSESNTIFHGIVKPKSLKAPDIIYNYIRTKICNWIINIDINTVTLVNGKLPNFGSSNISKGGQFNLLDIRCQLNINNIDVSFGNIGLTGIKTSVYVDPWYIIGLSKYLLCTYGNINITDPIIVKDKNGGIYGTLKEGFINLSEFIKRETENLATSQYVKNTEQFTNLFRSQQLNQFYPDKSTNEIWKHQLFDTLGTITITDSFKFEGIQSGIKGELKNVELYPNGEGVSITASKLICNDVMIFNSVHWKYGSLHEIYIESITGTFKPKDLNKFFPNETTPFKPGSKISNNIEKYFESEALQHFLEKVINPSEELQRLNLINIISDYSIKPNCTIEFQKFKKCNSVSIKTINLQFIQEIGESSVNLEIDLLKIELNKKLNKINILVPNLRLRDYVDGSVWSNIIATKDTKVSFVGGTLDISTPHKVYLNIDKRAFRFLNNYSKDTKIPRGKSVIRRIFTSHIEIIFSVKSAISLKDSKLIITPLKVEGPNLSEKIILKLLMDNDKIAVILEGIKPLRPFVKIIRDGIAILGINNRSGKTITERIQKFLHTSATEILEIGAEIGNLPGNSKISFYANQPLNIKNGLTDAGKEFVNGIEDIMDLIKQKSNAGLLDIPLIMIRPFTNSISKVMLGVLNELDPSRREIALNKY